jgi:hypothetical protein
MRKVSIGFLVLGVVVLIAWNWLWLWVPEWLFDLLTLQNGSAWYALTAVPPSTTGAYRILIFHFAEGSRPLVMGERSCQEQEPLRYQVAALQPAISPRSG